jgi:predicted enzyme related to lactoylglutathione lyase
MLELVYLIQRSGGAVVERPTPLKHGIRAELLDGTGMRYVVTINPKNGGDEHVK